MKMIRYIFGLILFCVLGFLSIGLLFPSTTYESTVTINRPVTKCWKIFNAEEHTDKWILGFKRMELLQGIPKKEGATYKMIFDDNGKEVSMTETTNTWIKEKEFSFLIDHDLMEIHTVVKFSEPAENTTTILANSTVVGKNLLYKSMFFFLKNTFKEKDMENYVRLKSFVESQEASQL